MLSIVTELYPRFTLNTARAAVITAISLLAACSGDSNPTEELSVSTQDGNMPHNSTTTNQPSPSSLSVYWIGHSLMEAQADTPQGKMTLMDMVENFTNSRELGYSAEQQILFGAPLSLHWRGQTHSYPRSVPEAKQRREAFQGKAGQFNTLVMTDTIPIGPTAQYEYSHYYWQQFYCTLLQQNPNAKVYVYESWRYYFGADQFEASGHYTDPQTWRRAMEDDHLIWRQLAEDTVKRAAAGPSRMQQWLGRIKAPQHPCANGPAITMIPVGRLMAKAYDTLLDTANAPRHINGRALRMIDWFDNPWINWPQERVEQLQTADSSRPMDDVHPSAVGVYFAALVHYAVLYEQPVQGLPDLAGLGAEISSWMQQLVDEQVSR